MIISIVWWVLSRWIVVVMMEWEKLVSLISLLNIVLSRKIGK